MKSDNDKFAGSQPEEYSDIPTINVDAGIETFNNRITTSKEALINDILMTLGYPLLTIELSEQHLDLCIKNALYTYTKYASFPERYICVDLGDYTDQGMDLKKLNMSVIKDINCIPPIYFGMSTSELAFGVSGMISQQITWKNFGFVSLQLLHEFKELAERMLYPKIDWTFNNITGKLLLYPDPRMMYSHQRFPVMVTGKNITNQNPTIPSVFTAEIEPPLEELYSNDAVKRMAIGYAKMMLGTIRSKFTGINLPGGAQLTGEALRIEGQETINVAIDEVKKTEAFGNMFVIA